MAVIDTGASVSLVPESLAKRLCMPIDKTAIPKIMTANGDHINMKGTIHLEVQIHDRTFPHVFYVMTEPERGKHVPILGNDFGMNAHLVIDQRGPAVYF